MFECPIWHSLFWVCVLSNPPVEDVIIIPRMPLCFSALSLSNAVSNGLSQKEA